ncbi:hypothetical protein [Comamonas thiooxydans]|uniref:hypothetical protein n=1 Tax=Comamonas thiooxydans TaxID=363952 RepID=UPI000B415110|nr:hypothetical protein [Comamonas thiooxydans]
MPLSSPQRFVLQDIQLPASRAWATGYYAKTVAALRKKGYIAWTERNGDQITELGRTALAQALEREARLAARRAVQTQKLLGT